ncbi:ParA family protein [Burkholderia multivorans]|nr:ParA family protein [Burkholderia multivorans]
MVAMKKISIVNGKGGTGKTTIVRHLVYTAIERGIRVLVVDLDPQGNLTRSMLYRKLTAKSGPSVMGAALTWEHLGLPDVTENSSAHLLYQGKRDVNPMRIVDGAAMIGATPELEDVMTWPLESAAKARESLDALADQFDLCVIDTAPTMSNLVLGGMICADYVVIPTDLGIDSMSGLLRTSEKLELVKREWNPDLELVGVLLNKVNLRRADDQSMRTTVRNAFDDAVLEHELRDRAGVRLTSFHPVWARLRGESDRLAAKEMLAVCDSILERIGLSVSNA